MKSITIILVLGICALLVMAAVCLQHEYQLSKEQSTIYIESLAFNSEMDGSFLLGSGSISEEQYYYFYRIESDGALTLQKTLVSQSRIYRDATPDTARIELRDSFTGDYLVCSAMYKENVNACIWDSGSHITYLYRVPPGTVTRNFNADVRSVQG